MVKALGGGSRQIGFMAAAGIYALDNMVTRLQDDHDNIQIIANSKSVKYYITTMCEAKKSKNAFFAAIREMNHPAIKVLPVEKIQTNILNVYFDSNTISANDFLAKLETVKYTILYGSSSERESKGSALSLQVSKDGPNTVIRALAIMGNSIRFVACCNVPNSDMTDVVVKLRYVINEFK